MNISSNYTGKTEGNYAGMAGRKMDSFSQGIQNQIANAQKKLQDLSSNGDMSLEEKMKKRQEIQKQIHDLNNQLRQHQIEQRNEKQTVKAVSSENPAAGTRKSGKKDARRRTGISQAGMEALISADQAMSQASVQQGVATDLEGKARVLQSEIRQDAAQGGDTSTKQEALAKLEDAAANATAAQIQTLGEAGQKMSAAADEETAVKDSANVEEDEKQEEEKEQDIPREVTVNVLV